MAQLIGVFGGTFDPPHLGHLILADDAMASLGLDSVLWVVAGDPPHKPARPLSPAEVRVEMVAAAIRGTQGFKLSRADVDRPGPHYTMDSLRALREGYPGADFAYLMGSDSLRDLPTWREPEGILEAVQVLGVMRRPGGEPDLPALEARLPGLSGKLRIFHAPFVEISGTEIRRRVAAGLPFRFLVPAAVGEIIRQRGLYRFGD